MQQNNRGGDSDCDQQNGQFSIQELMLGSQGAAIIVSPLETCYFSGAVRTPSGVLIEFLGKSTPEGVRTDKSLGL